MGVRSQKVTAAERNEAYRRLMCDDDKLTPRDLEILYPGMPLVRQGIWENVLAKRAELAGEAASS